MKSNDISTIDFCDIKLVCATRDEFAKFAIEKSREYKSIISYSLNGESLAKYHNDASFPPLFLHADYVHADGMSIVKASKLLCKPSLPERIATTDWFHDVAKLCEETGETHYFLGGSQETIEKTIQNVQRAYPLLNIVGYRNGYFDENQLKQVVDEINECSPHFVWVGLGRPKQENVSALLKRDTKVGVIKTCGGLFDFLAGSNRRAPMLLQKIGMEWAFRLSLEPRRLFKRYFVTNYQSLIIFMKYYVQNKQTK
ncbi:WecB/TagA/CpsF family glycosyltransferase [Sphingobacterium psychroaquaticum]|uniref:Polymer biosynthesis protein, WecB/TagA/CpsF family n=1 Tax=Sphingobacterium psychroaquaticum TaxID=561061 RepID=A0A1X7L156_9SPHI|nr:WecB/TagA/CpsF family glycosyltransferase [Sphingobacterium psychroaquaticum]QBQ39827.1 glycosyltransferase [Sphingobacterium psychroaquaticum]SMG47541.1 polymer biosynthesis protein, WecB/TagA/CpsF family [Sphingobacterium psychroaquaticum]